MSAISIDKWNDPDERDARITKLLDRGIEAALRAFDPDHHLLWGPSATRPGQRTYTPFRSLPLAHALLCKGDVESLKQAVAIIEAVLASQEMTPQHPHLGNWLWLADDKEVVDLNAVQFVLRGLLPLLILQGEKLPIDLLKSCRERVRLALSEIERLDVAPSYTNIHLMSLFSLLIGGEWLDDEHFLKLGKDRWARWVHFTIQSGAPHEYNSPNYGAVDLSALATLHQLVRNPTIRLQARLLYERFWLHFALHVHRATRQLAGPHCRCYWENMWSGQGPLKEILWRETGWLWLLEPGPYGGRPTSEFPWDEASLELALADHWLPEHISVWLQKQEMFMPYEVRETADLAQGFDLTTYFTPSYSLGTASRTYGIGTDCFYIEHQANYLILYYVRPNEPVGWGLMYSRYVVNDRHWGTIAAAPDRPKTLNFYDQGHFAGVQLRNKAIGLYALMPQHEEVFSLKTIVCFQSGNSLKQVWLNDQPLKLDEVPYPLRLGDWLIVEDRSVYIAVHALKPSCLGREAPLLLERGPLGELWLSIYNYRGPTKRFWEYASLRGAFWRGNICAGFIVEVSERTEFSSAKDFLTHLRQATIEDVVDDKFIRTVKYRSGHDELLLRYDLWNSVLVERKLNGNVYKPPNLDSPLAVQGSSGCLKVGQATLVTNPQQVWLEAQELDSAKQVWIAVNPLDRPTPMRLETPCGVVTIEEWGMGRLEWRAPLGEKETLIIDTLKKPVGLQVPDGVTVHYRNIGL